MSASRRVLILLISVFLDTHDCALKCLQCLNDELNAYYETLCAAVAREEDELDDKFQFIHEEFCVLMRVLDKQMREEFCQPGRKGPNYTLLYWEECSENASAVSPVAFSKIVKASLSFQASSANAERLFSDLERHEGRERQCFSGSSLEMTETICNYGQTSLNTLVVFKLVCRIRRAMRSEKHILWWPT